MKSLINKKILKHLNKLIIPTIFILLLIFGFFLRKDILRFFWINISDIPRFVEVSSDINSFSETAILMGFRDNLIITPGKEDEWDQTFREIGNIIYYPKLSKYLIFYSAHNGEQVGNNVFIGAAISTDGIYWKKIGKIMDSPAEDPYAIVHNDLIYLFYEDKSDIPFRKIDLAIADETLKFELKKEGVIYPTTQKSWMSSDVSSPIVIFNKDKGNWLMFFEGRNLKSNPGAIGYATSENLLDWTVSKEKIFPKTNKFFGMFFSWNSFAVPDDLILEKGKYYMTYHGISHKHIWQSGILVSDDLIQWKEVNKFPIHPNSTVMFDRIENLRFFLADKDGIKFYHALSSVIFPNYKYGKQYERIDR